MAPDPFSLLCLLSSWSYSSIHPEWGTTKLYFSLPRVREPICPALLRFLISAGLLVPFVFAGLQLLPSRSPGLRPWLLDSRSHGPLVFNLLLLLKLQIFYEVNPPPGRKLSPEMLFGVRVGEQDEQQLQTAKNGDGWHANLGLLEEFDYCEDHNTERNCHVKFCEWNQVRYDHILSLVSVFASWL